LVVLLVFAVGGEGGFWWGRYPLKTRFTNAGGGKAGAVVRLSGKEVGTVKKVAFDGPQIDVSLELLKDVRPLVTTDSTAKIGSLSLLGEPVIDLTASSTGTPLKDGEYVKTGATTVSLDQLTSSASASLDQMDKLL